MDKYDFGKKITILVAENEESNFLLLETILKKHTNILHARTGNELLQMYQDEHPDLILMNIKIPEMNGLEALKKIRKIDIAIPVIMQSDYLFENEVEAASEAGCSDFIRKPASVAILKNTIKRYFPSIEF